MRTTEQEIEETKTEKTCINNIHGLILEGEKGRERRSTEKVQNRSL